MSQFPDHLQIIRHPFIKTFCLIRFSNLFQIFHLCTQIHINLSDCLINTLLRRHEKVCRINIQFVLFIDFLSGHRIKRRNTINLISPEFNPISNAIKCFNGREYIYRITIHTETSTIEFQFIIDIKRSHKPTEQFIPVNLHPSLQMSYFLGKRPRISHTVETGYRRNHNYIPPSRQQRSRCPQAEFINFIIYSQIFLDIGICRRQISLRLVIIIIRDKIFDRIIRKERLKLTI